MELAAKVVAALKEGAAVAVGPEHVLTARHYPGYDGRNPRTGAPVPVPPKTLAFFGRRASVDVKPAFELSLGEELVSGARVWHLAGLGLIRAHARGLSFRAFRSFVAALNGHAAPAVVSGDEVRACLARADAALMGDAASALAVLRELRDEDPVRVDLHGLEADAGATLPSLAKRTLEELAGCELGPLGFHEPAPSEDDPAQLAFAAQDDEGAYYLAIRDGEAIVIETNARPNHEVSLATFLVHAAVVVPVVIAANEAESPLAEDDAVPVVRALVGATGTWSRLLDLMPL